MLPTPGSYMQGFRSVPSLRVMLQEDHNHQYTHFWYGEKQSLKNKLTVGKRARRKRVGRRVTDEKGCQHWETHIEDKCPNRTHWALHKTY